MAKRKDKVTKDELIGLCRARRQAIQSLEKHLGTPDSSDILTKKMEEITSDLANEIADKLQIFLGDKPETQKSSAAQKVPAGIRD